MSLLTKQLNILTCPLYIIEIKNKLNEKTWITRTLKNRIRKKYKLYKNFILILIIYPILQTLHYIIKRLTYIVNLSFKIGIFSGKMRQAQIIPIYKKGEKIELFDYRPISLLPQIRRVGIIIIIIIINLFEV